MRLARGKIDEMLELIQEMSSSRINPARLIHATTELCEGVEENLPDFDVTSLQIGDLEVKVERMVVKVEEVEEGSKVEVEQVPSCDVTRLRETRNLKEPSLSFEKMPRATLQVRFTVSLPSSEKIKKVVRMTSQGDHVVVVCPDVVLLLGANDCGLLQKISHTLMEDARAAVEIPHDQIAVACGCKSKEEAKIILYSSKSQFLGVLAEGDYCDLAFAGKKIFALCSEKGKICTFASNARSQ